MLFANIMYSYYLLYKINIMFSSHPQCYKTSVITWQSIKKLLAIVIQYQNCLYLSLNCSDHVRSSSIYNCLTLTDMVDLFIYFYWISLRILTRQWIFRTSTDSSIRNELHDSQNFVTYRHRSQCGICCVICNFLLMLILWINSNH